MKRSLDPKERRPTDLQSRTPRPTGRGEGHRGRGLPDKVSQGGRGDVASQLAGMCEKEIGKLAQELRSVEMHLFSSIDLVVQRNMAHDDTL